MFDEDEKRAEGSEETALAPDAAEEMFEEETEDPEAVPEAEAGFDEFGGDKEHE